MTPQQWGVFYKGENKMASTGNSGNTGTATSASQAQSQAASTNAANSNAANSGNGNSSNTSGTSGDGKGNAGSTNTSTSNTSTGATNSAGLMGSLIGFGNAVANGEVSNGGRGGSSNNKSNEAANNRSITRTYAEAVKNGSMTLEEAAVDAANKAYTKSRAEGKTEKAAQKDAQAAAAKAYYSVAQPSEWSVGFLSNIKGKNTGPTYNPSITAQATTNKTIAKGSSEMGPSTPAASVTLSAPANTVGSTEGPAAGSTSTESASAAPSTNDAANTGITNRGSTVANGSGTAVTDSGTGGSISSSVTPPSRDASSIGLGVYNTDRANYDQDNWNRGMEAESSSLVSDEECKAFAKRAFLENSEPFKRVRVTIIKKC